MRATVMYKAGDVRIENIPDAAIEKPTDAVIRIARTCICGSDLWPYNELQPTAAGIRMGHEAIGIVEAVGADVRGPGRRSSLRGNPRCAADVLQQRQHCRRSRSGADLYRGVTPGCA
jgi:threonine dehydrogenase-like Zn-dependent dehydrogenase